MFAQSKYEQLWDEKNKLEKRLAETANRLQNKAINLIETASRSNTVVVFFKTGEVLTKDYIETLQTVIAHTVARNYGALSKLHDQVTCKHLVSLRLIDNDLSDIEIDYRELTKIETNIENTVFFSPVFDHSIYEL